MRFFWIKFLKLKECFKFTSSFPDSRAIQIRIRFGSCVNSAYFPFPIYVDVIVFKNCNFCINWWSILVHLYSLRSKYFSDINQFVSIFMYTWKRYWLNNHIIWSILHMHISLNIWLTPVSFNSMKNRWICWDINILMTYLDCSSNVQLDSMNVYTKKFQK